MLAGRDHLARAEAVMVAAVAAAVPTLAAALDLVARFHRVVRARTPDALKARIGDATGSMLALFGRGIADVQAAGRAALTEPWSNGATEGSISKLKLVRHQLCGRGKLDPLRARLAIPAGSAAQRAISDRVPLPRLNTPGVRILGHPHAID